MSKNTHQPDSNLAITPPQAPTPSVAAASRAFTFHRDDPHSSTHSPGSDMERARTQSTPATPLSEAKTAGDFKPFKLLMETEITLHYGNKFKERRIIHEEILSCHSQSARELFKKAATLREAYPRANELRKQLKEFISTYESEKQFEETHMEKQAIVYIIRICDHYPLPAQRNVIRQFVDDVIAEQVGKRLIIAPAAKGALHKKDLKGMGLQLRLQSLSSKAVRIVSELLLDKLRDIKYQDRKAAETSPVKAAAQHRMFLPNTEDRVIRSLVQWTYCQGVLNYDDAEHLYALHTLAARIGMKQLEQQCLSSLASGTADIIQHALSQGLTLQQVLGLGVEPENGQQALAASNVAEVVFHHVLSDKVSPKRLVTLVVDALAKYLEPGLWDQLEPKIVPSMSLLLIKAILVRRQVKGGETRDPNIKFESASTSNDYALFALNERT